MITADNHHGERRMISNERIIAMMTCGSQPFTVSSGGTPIVSRDMVHAAMAGLPTISVQLALVKYAGVDQDRPALMRGAYIRMVDMAIVEGWKPVQGKAYFRRIAELAMERVLQPERCRRCNGLGHTGTGRNCDRCEGTGRRTPSQRELGRLADIPWGSWSRQWYWRHKMIYQHFCELDNMIFYLIRENLSG